MLANGMLDESSIPQWDSSIPSFATISICVRSPTEAFSPFILVSTFNHQTDSQKVLGVLSWWLTKIFTPLWQRLPCWFISIQWRQIGEEVMSSQHKLGLKHSSREVTFLADAKNHMRIIMTRNHHLQIRQYHTCLIALSPNSLQSGNHLGHYY